MKHPCTLAAAFAATLLLAFSAQPASAVCTPFLCYIDLAAGGGAICNPAFTILQSHTVQNTGTNPTCNAASWRAVVARVQVPNDCTGVAIWVEYEGSPEGFTLDVGDSETNNGFAGDAGSLPTGQNAELQILNENLTVYNAGDNPVDSEELATHHLALRDGSIQVIVKDQFVSWGQPYSALSTPDLERLFFLPPGPLTPPENRTIYVGFNRVVAPIGGQDASRNGCGARRALLILQ